MTAITDTPCTVTVNGHTFTGREWIADAPMPHAGETAATYRVRNAGKTRTSYALLGIPYAVQPVGDMRLRPGQKVAPSGPIDASGYGPVPPQGYEQEGFDTGRGRSDLGIDRGLSAWGDLGTREGEACLNLNIQSPDLDPNAGLPVLHYIHPGGGRYLSACDDRLSGHRMTAKGVLASRGDYRVGNLGHYYLPGMEDEAGYQGVNFAVTDVIAQLEWIRDHISDLGGDPDNVTIAGGSYGGEMCLTLLAHPYARTLFKRAWVSSPSGGTQVRWQEAAKGNTSGYKTLFGQRRQMADLCGAYQRSTQNPLKTLAQVKAELVTAGATVDEAHRTAMREHMSLSNFMSFDDGATGRQLYYEGYQATRTTTIMRDEETCFHDSTLDFALSGDVPGTHDLVIWCCEDEASVIGGGGSGYDFTQGLHDLCNATAQQWAGSAVFNTEWNAGTAVPLWGTVSATFPIYPWGAATEPNRMIFNDGYRYPAYCMARAVEAAGATAYLGLFNWKPLAGGRVGHTGDEPIWMNNPLWAYPEGGDELLTEAAIAMADRCAQLLANFCKSGDPNEPYAYAGDFDLFEDPLTFGLTAFDPDDRNWNVAGNTNRSASTTTTIANVPGFWDHAWDLYDSRNGVS